MNLSQFLEDDEQLNEHEIAWRSADWGKVEQLTEEYKEKAENVLFELLNQLTVGKTPQNLAQCDQYLKTWIDLGLSQHADCIDSVFRMNLLGAGLSNQGHFNYYLHAISQGKRFGKWAKLTEDAQEKLVLTLIQRRWNINRSDAMMYRDNYKSKGKLPELLKSLKFMATDDFVKTITKSKPEQKQLTKFIKEW